MSRCSRSTGSTRWPPRPVGATANSPARSDGGCSGISGGSRVCFDISVCCFSRQLEEAQTKHDLLVDILHKDQEHKRRLVSTWNRSLHRVLHVGYVKTQTLNFLERVEGAHPAAEVLPEQVEGTETAGGTRQEILQRLPRPAPSTSDEDAHQRREGENWILGVKRATGSFLVYWKFVQTEKLQVFIGWTNVSVVFIHVCLDVSAAFWGGFGATEGSAKRAESLRQGAASGKAKALPGSRDINGELLQRPGRIPLAFCSVKTAFTVQSNIVLPFLSNSFLF